MKTLKQIRDKVISDLDLYNEDFATDAELNEWIRDGVAIAEAEIHNLYQDYFLSETDMIPISTSNPLIPYPDDIYGNKIRSIICQDIYGTVYKVKRANNPEEELMNEMITESTMMASLRWFNMNRAGVGRGIRLTPASSINGSIKVLYIRNAKELILDDDVCDIDEFSRVIEQHAKTQAYLKDGDPRANDSQSLEQYYIEKMKETLADMAADRENEIEADMTFYEESV